MNGYNSLMEAVRVGALEGCIYYKKEKKHYIERAVREQMKGQETLTVY